MRGRKIAAPWHDYPAAMLGYAETSLIGWLMDNVGPGQTWLDVGAYYGYTSLCMALRTGPAGRVFAFEPNLTAAGLLAQTRALNNLPHLRVCPFALGSEKALTPRRLYTVRGMIDSQIGPQEADGAELFYSAAFDALWPRWRGNRPEVHGIKMDVQGAEVEALKGMAVLLCEQRPLLALEIHSGVDRRAVLAVLETADYDLRPRPVENFDTDFFDPQSNHSFVFQPREVPPRKQWP